MIASSPTNTSILEDVWFVYSSASKHMTSHQEWFPDLREPEQPSYVEIGDDTIQHVGNVPFGKDGEQTYIKNGLHVPTIAKNLVSIAKIVEQGMQFRFNDRGYFNEKGG